jgi:hypothetical protein
MEIAATKASTGSATKRIIAKIMRASAKLPIGISHAPIGFLAAFSIPTQAIWICLIKPKLF